MGKLKKLKVMKKLFWVLFLNLVQKFCYGQGDYDRMRRLEFKNSQLESRLLNIERKQKAQDSINQKISNTQNVHFLQRTELLTISLYTRNIAKTFYLPHNIPKTTNMIIADVFVSNSGDDYFTLTFSSQCRANVRYLAQNNASLENIILSDQMTIYTKHRDVSYYGFWRSSMLIPVNNGRAKVCAYGQDHPANLQILVRGYYV